ncbi:MAG TPA: YHS domain-containing protein [Edaphobacter sp.]|nr:YHS domain-containing protein [Edaphobacter sp.]
MSCCLETSTGVVKDPVCGMQVDPAKAAGPSQYQGLIYSFCSLGCKKKFDLNPVQYMPQPLAVPPIAGMSKMATSGKNICPMHP